MNWMGLNETKRRQRNVEKLENMVRIHRMSTKYVFLRGLLLFGPIKAIGMSTKLRESLSFENTSKSIRFLLSETTIVFFD